MDALTRLTTTVNACDDLTAIIAEIRAKRAEELVRIRVATEQSILNEALTVRQKLKVSEVAERADWIDRVNADDAAKLVRDLAAADKFDVLIAIHQEIKAAIKAAKSETPETPNPKGQ